MSILMWKVIGDSKHLTTESYWL